MRLIDADTLYDKAEERYKSASGSYRKIYRGFVDDVADAPTVDAAPVVHGRWIKASVYGIPHYRCSVCSEYIELDWTANFEYSYCPNCGAKMDLPEDGE